MNLRIAALVLGASLVFVSGCQFPVRGTFPDKAPKDDGKRNTNTVDPAQASLIKPPAPTPPPGHITIQYSGVATTYTVGDEIEIKAPIVKGAQLEGFTSDPQLPRGFELDPETGAITGKAREATPARTYVITADLASGARSNAMTKLTFAVSADSGSVKAYAHDNLTLVAGIDVGEFAPEEGKGDDFAQDADHPLPEGLHLDGETGKITGNPAAPQVRAEYAISFEHENERHTQNLSIAVTTATEVRLAGGLACAHLANGEVACWGRPKKSNSIISPVRLTGDGALKPITMFATGPGVTCAVTEAGKVFCWKALAPSGAVRSEDGRAELTGVAAVAVGATHACARTGTDVLCWGSNAQGELGLGEAARKTKSFSKLPVRIAALSKRVVALSAAGHRTCALLTDHSVACWGQQSDGGATAVVATPTAVDQLKDAVSISVSATHGCAVQTDGSVSCWGANAFGQLGDGTQNAYRGAVRVVNLGARATMVATGEGFSCALLENGGIKCWGRNHKGQAGAVASSKPLLTATAVGGFARAVSSLAAAEDTACAISGGQALCWGSNETGQLGNPDAPKATNAPEIVRPWR